MAITRIQATPFGSVSTNVLTLTFSTPPLAGHGVVVTVGGRQSGFSFTGATCTDNYSNTYLQATSIIQASGTDVACAIYYCESVINTGSSFTVTLTLTSGIINIHGIAIEVNTSITADKVIGAIGSSTAPATGATAALTANEEFVVGVHVNSATQASVTVESVSPTWTQEYENLPIVSAEGNSRSLSGVSGLTTSISWTLTATTTWAAVLAAFKELLPAASVNVTQDVIEVLSLPVPDARVGQYVVEVLSATTPVPGRVTQYVVEVLSQNVELVTTSETTQFMIIMP